VHDPAAEDRTGREELAQLVESARAGVGGPDGEVGEPAGNEAASQVRLAEQAGGRHGVEIDGLVAADGLLRALHAGDGPPGGKIFRFLRYDVRLEADWVHTTFFDQSQNNYQAALDVVFHF